MGAKNDEPEGLRRHPEDLVASRVADGQHCSFEPTGPGPSAGLARNEPGLEPRHDELRRSNAALETALAGSNQLFEFAPVGFFVVAPDGAIRRVNLAGARIVGVERAVLVGSKLGAFFTSGDAARFEDLLASALADQEQAHGSGSEACELTLGGKGPSREVRLAASKLPEAEAGTVQVLLAVEDITERKRAEQEAGEVVQRYERQVRLFEGVTSTTPDFVYLFDVQGRFLYANRRLLEVWGMELRDVIGRTCRQLGYEQWHHDMHMREIAQVIATKRPIKGEVPFKAPLTGIFGVYEYIFTPVIGPDGEVETIAGTTRDVTERKQHEEALREADRRKDEFLGMLSHELRNPLAPIRSAAFILEHADPNGEPAQRARRILRRQTEHLTRLVDDLLDLTRITRGKIALQRRRIDLREVVTRSAEDLRGVLSERGVVFRLSVPEEAAWADADVTRLTQVVLNLLQNAAKFTRRGDEVWLSMRIGGGGAEIRVGDTGAGIDAGLLARIFEPFVQGDRTLARSQGGLGLGLALVKGIVELHGGAVHAESGGIGKGSEFIVQLPLRSGAPAPLAEVASRARGRGRQRVLVVDDNVDAANSLADLLRLLGHEVEVAHDGPSALEKLEASTPDIVCCDIGLPGMSGYDVARQVRDKGKAIRLVAVSGYARADDVKRAREAGFDAHLAKPPDPDEIARLLDG